MMVNNHRIVLDLPVGMLVLALLFLLLQPLRKVSHAQTGDFGWVSTEALGWKLEGKIVNRVTVPYQSPVFIMRITNMSNQSKPLPRLNSVYGDLTFEFTTSQGVRVPGGQYIADVMGKPDTSTWKLNPGEQFETDEDLLAFACFHSNPMLGASFDPGEYRVVVSLYVDPLGELPRNQNTLRLPPLDFRVIEPTGDTAKALDLFRKALLARVKDRPFMLKTLFEILEKYSSTPYDEVANLRLVANLTAFGGVDPSEIVRICTRCFLKYPGTPGGCYIMRKLIPLVSQEEFRRLCGQIKTRDDARLTLKLVREEFPWALEGEQK